VEAGQLDILSPANLPRLFDRRMVLKTAKTQSVDPSVADVLVAIDKLDHRNWNDAFLILSDCAWDNAFVQTCMEPTEWYWIEYRGGATQLQYRTLTQVPIEVVKMVFITYLRQGDEVMRCAIKWEEVTATLLS
jgi:hypothetical protein